MTFHPRIPWPSRLLALLLGILFAVQPVVRAGAPCEARSLLAGRPGSGCCCAARTTLDAADGSTGRTATMPCCGARAEEAALGGPGLQRASCGCDLRAPAPGDVPPGSSDPRAPNAEGAGKAADWIAKGARVSAASPVHSFACPFDLRSLPSPDIGFLASCGRRLSAPDAAARSCARGVNGLLAVLGVALL